jgi:glycosyltransferase involved in cell wall biosynthesis
METSALVSVILPTYNRAEWLQKSIDSVIKQTYPYWELIIWDDGSTDNTEEIVRSYNDKRLKYYYDKNHGVYYARNRSLTMSQGKYLAFLDSDDQWADEKLSVQVEVMNTHPQIDVLFGDFLNIDLLTKEKQSAFDQYSIAMKFLNIEQIDDSLYIIKDGILESLTVSNFIAMDSVILRRELFKRRLCFFKKLRNSEDFEFWWRIGLAGICFAYISKVYVTRYKLPVGLSSPSIITYENKIKGLDFCLQETLARGRKDLIPYLNQPYRNAWQNMIPLYAANGNRKGMLKAFSRSIRYGFNLGSVRLLCESINKSKNMKL